MANEIDLNSVLAALRRRWWVIALFTVLALALVLAAGMAQPRSYQASSVLLVQYPRFQWRFDGSFQPLTETQRDWQRDVLAVSRSNEVVQAALQTLQAAGYSMTADELAAAVGVRAGDGRTVVVTATAPDPNQAAAMANAWSDGLIALTRRLYGYEGYLANFRKELEAAARRVAELDTQIEQGRAASGLYGLTAGYDRTMTKFAPNQQRLEILNRKVAEYETDLAALRYLLDQMAQPGVDLRLLPWERLAGPVLSQRGIATPERAQALLSNPTALAELLRQEERSLAASLAALQAELAPVQAEVAHDWRVYDDLLRERNLARELYQVLTRKVTELEMQARVEPGLVTVVSQATPPSRPVRTRQLAQLVTAAGVGLILGTIAALWLDAAATRRARRSAAMQQPAAGR
ncbi:MAG: Wzz/FepE/Etk N-terminal domain-containing protein [Caldilineales bacterium]|nr:Wzz/FepE/Etk N-terminal domain-containing protein [Caldilineales bacterium]MDW8317500.1 Wzz/FepE/Etk N-terminal domain-containing protein [Anaerolineae bacterium]